MKIIKIPTSQGSLGKNIGCEKAPDNIVEKLKKEFWLNEEFNQIDFRLDEVKVTENNQDKALNEVYQKVKNQFTEKIFFIGGDHSITYATFKAFQEKFKNSALLIFDAHPDIDFPNRTQTHEDFVMELIQEGILKKDNLIYLGLRSFSKSEHDFLKQNKIRFFTMKQIYNNTEFICDTIMELLKDFEALYISIDIDVLDPGFAPGTGYLEPAGMSSREIIYFLQRLKLLKNLKALDLVEVNPDKDINERTIKLAAKIIAELV